MNKFDIQVMPRKAAEERGLIPLPLKEQLHPMPRNIWRPTLTEQQKKEQEKQVAEGVLPF